MANELLTPKKITAEALRIFHQKSVFINAINKQYKNEFARSGAKIGDTVNIRDPNEYVIRDGLLMNPQDIKERSRPLTITHIRGVDMSFDSKELTLTMDDFSKRYVKPAISRLAAEVDSLIYGELLKTVPNIVDGDGQKASMNLIGRGREILNNNLAPPDGERTVILSPVHARILASDLSLRYNPQSDVSKVHREGLITHSLGFDFRESTFARVDKATGTAAKTTGYVVDGAGQTGGNLLVKTGATTFKKGDIITIAGVFDVHPETKDVTADLKTFVVTEDYAGGAGSIKIYPDIIPVALSGTPQLNTVPRATVGASPANSAAIVKVGAGASETLNNSLMFHRDAFTLATVDLDVPKGLDIGSRQNYDGVSMRYLRDFDITTSRYLTRFDVMFGFAALRPEWACRFHADLYV
jgi:hypothetical protein